MNNLIYLRGKLNHRARIAGQGITNIPKGSSITYERILELHTGLLKILEYWLYNNKLNFKPLVEVHYIKIVAKTNRISNLFDDKNISSNDAIKGARFSSITNPRHIITYCVSVDCIKIALEKINKCLNIVQRIFNGEVNYNNIDNLFKSSKQFPNLSKSAFAQIIKDLFYIERFSIPNVDMPSLIKNNTLVSIYDTGISYSELILKLGFENEKIDRYDDFTWLLTPEQYIKLSNSARFLISMSTEDISEFNVGIEINKIGTNNLSIPEPSDEPVVGVIDTQFSKNVYFNKWVDYKNCLDESLVDDDINGKDYRHGTIISSLIVDAPSLNPNFDDGCGRFRVRHFGVAVEGKNSSLSIIRQIRTIVSSNRDIKVWNLSLGSEAEIEENKISPEAWVLDDLQYEFDVIFVVSGTNNNNNKKEFPRIGSPADSLNSIVVNSVTFDGKPANYSRKGPVLCFFRKPDVSYYGGDSLDGIKVCCPGNSIEKVQGTSFAAPWITRKLAYLIYIMKLPREVAKALIIDSAAGWKIDEKNRDLIGYGRVPAKIDDVLKTKDDEIKFFIYGKAEQYDTYAYNIPLPKSKEKYPFTSKVTFCYFPKCSRNQGVDYTDTELNIHFGRVDDKNRIKSINGDNQGLEKVYEDDARDIYRKWDNVKHICEKQGRNSAKKSYGNREWGVSVKINERLGKKSGQGLPFGAVITLKEIDGKNRFDEFVRLCRAEHNWDVQICDMDVMVKNYALAEEEVEFDE